MPAGCFGGDSRMIVSKMSRGLFTASLKNDLRDAVDSRFAFADS